MLFKVVLTESMHGVCARSVCVCSDVHRVLLFTTVPLSVCYIEHTNFIKKCVCTAALSVYTSHRAAPHMLCLILTNYGRVDCLILLQAHQEHSTQYYLLGPTSSYMDCYVFNAGTYPVYIQL